MKMIKYDKNKRWDYFYTIIIFINNFAFGVCINLFFASLVDLSFVYNTSINTFSSVNIAFCFGYMIGSLANFLYKWVNRQLALAFFVLIQAIALLLLPFYSHLWLVFGMMFLMNIGAGSWEAAASVWLVEIWPVSNSALLQGLQFCYGLGCIVAPLLASPFVYGTQNVTETNHTITVTDRIELLAIPFTLAGIAQAIAPIMLFLTFFISPYIKKQTKTAIQIESKSISKKQIESQTRKTISCRKTKLTLLGICFGCYIAAEFGFITFSTSMYQYMDIRLSADQSAKITALLLTTYTFGRLATAFISLKLKNDVIILYHFLIQLGSLTFLYFGRDNLTMIYIGTFSLGYGFSALYPAIFAFTQEYIGLTERVCSMYAFLVGGTCLLTPLVLSQVFNSYPVVLMLISSAFITISFSLFIIVRIWIAFDMK